MKTKFTDHWISCPENQKILSKAKKISEDISERDIKSFHPFAFFQEMFSEGAIFSSPELCRIGWSKRAIRKHLREEIIFSFAGIDLFLKGAVEEVALDLPNGKLKTEIALHKLLS